MLYERWRQMAREHGDEFALQDLGSGRRWTFSELAAATESHAGSEAQMVFPQGMSAEFVLAVLRAWRVGQRVCPLEAGQCPPSFSEWPAGCVHLKSTSASTGVARVVAFKASQLMADAENIVATMGLRPEWPNLGLISLAHSYGFSNLVLPLLLHGIPLVLVDSQLPEALRRSVAALPNATLAAVPALWRAWHEAGALSPHIRLAISAGAPLPLSLEAEVFAQSGVKIHNFYGATECGGIAYDASSIPRTDGACVGSAMQNVQLFLNAEGCLQVRSGAVGESYWPERDSHLADGCYQTSDLAELSNGLVYLRGRASDQINVAGRKVSPETLERVLLSHPAVRECLVFGVPSADPTRGEVIVGCVAVKSPVAVDDLRRFAASKLPAWQVPREWWFVEALQTNQRGKISRLEWRRRYLEDRRSIVTLPEQRHD